MAVNYLHSGLRFVEFDELRRAPSQVHRAIYKRIGALITASDALGELPLAPGRAGPEFIARLFDLEEFAKERGVSVNDAYLAGRAARRDC